MNVSSKTKSAASAVSDDCAVLTPRQVQILRLINEYRSKNGCSPTLQEIARELSLSKVTVFEHVDALVRKGLLLRLPNKARSLTLSPAAKLDGVVLGAEQAVADDGSINAGSDNRGRFLLAGRIAAGVPFEAIQNPEVLDLTSMFQTAEPTFAVRAQGDSMIDEQIRDGDYVIVQKTSQVRDGQTVVALLENGEATLKKFYREGSGFRLEAANPDFAPIHTKKLHIQGVVIGVVRRY